MKLMKRIAVGLAAAAAALTLPLTVTANAKREFPDCIENIRVYDTEGVLTDAQEKELNTLLLNTSGTIDMYVAVVVVGPETSFSDDEDVETYAKSAYIKLFDPDPNKDTDGCLLLLNDSTNYDYLATQGLGQLYYYNGSPDRSWDILESITPSLKAGDHAAAIREFCAQLEYYYEQGIPEGAYTYNNGTGEYLYYQNGEIKSGDKLPAFYNVHWKPILIAAGVIGLIVGLITMLIIKSSYKLKKSLAPDNYVSRQETQFHVQDDMFLRTHTSKVYLGDSSRSGGGGGGGHSSSFGGHSFGGGGHHR